MREEIKNPKNAVEHTTKIQQKTVVSVARKMMRTKILVSKELNKNINACIKLFTAKKNRDSLKIKSQTDF